MIKNLCLWKWYYSGWLGFCHKEDGEVPLSPHTSAPANPSDAFLKSASTSKPLENTDTRVEAAYIVEAYALEAQRAAAKGVRAPLLPIFPSSPIQKIALPKV
jgi:hypothetical protein